jgi:hypothetical protein
MIWCPAMVECDPHQSESIRGYDSDELLRRDLWFRQIAGRRRRFIVMREDQANGDHTVSVKRSNETVELLDTKLQLPEMNEINQNALEIVDLITSGEILSYLTVFEVTETLRGLLDKLDVETQKEVMKLICWFLD